MSDHVTRTLLELLKVFLNALPANDLQARQDVSAAIDAVEKYLAISSELTREKLQGDIDSDRE